MDFFVKLLNSDFMPHVYCLRLPEVIWLYVLANAGIALAYFFIPPTLVFFIRKRRDIAFSWMFLLFGLFILACGATHVLDIITLWYPIYRLDVLVRLITAVTSVATAVLLVRILPQTLLLPNPEQLREEIAKRTQAQEALEQLNQVLEERVLERTATLNASNAELESTIQELSYQLELNRAIMTQAGDSILCTDQDGKVVFINPRAEATFAYSSEELLGLNLHDVLHVSPLDPQPQEASDCTLVKAASQGTLLHDWSTQFYKKDGSVVQVACSAGPIEVNGKRSGSVIIARDITERVKAERALKESELQYRTLVEAMPQMVWSARSDGYVDFFSTQWERYTGKSDNEQLGSLWHNVVHPLDLEPTKQAWQSAVVSTSNYEVEHRLQRFDGVWRWFKTRAVALFSEEGKPIRWLGTSTDIDANKHATAVLEQYNADLKNLASAMAHDLHEPLRAIAVQTQMLARHVRNELDGKGEEIVARVIDSATQMRRLLQDITIYSESITRPLDIRRFQLGALVEEVLTLRREKLKVLNVVIGVEIEPELSVEADYHSLRLVFNQLLDNALAYRRPDSDLKIDILAQFCEGEIVVSFSDNGIGISPEYHERVFQLFKRLHKHHEYPGSGIGLAMCQKILQRHGKRIWVRSNPSSGAVFFFSMQAAARQHQLGEVAHAPVAG